MTEERLQYNVSLARYNSWHVGGLAERFYKPKDLNALSEFLRTQSKSHSITWLGLGSNVLVRDGGIKGTVIATQGALNRLTPHQDGSIRAEAGVTCAKLAKLCARLGYEEGAFFAGIPGTIGGALAMNAGAFGGETWQYVESVDTIDRAGHIHTRPKDAFAIHYRHVERPENEWFVSALLRFTQGKPDPEQRVIKALLRKRSKTQPVGEFNCGSVFRNPSNGYAAQLIEQCGLKGTRIGGAWVSEKHANFIINGGQATAKDIETLIHFVADCVNEKTGIQLIPEVHILGEHLQ